MLNLAWPWALVLLPLPLLYRWLASPLKDQRPALRAAVYSRLALQQGGRGSPQRRPVQWLALLLSLFLWLGVVVAVARPQWIGEAIALPSSGRDLMLAVDISESMKIEDMVSGDDYLPRLSVVKDVVEDFVERRTGDKLGLILFGSQAYLQAPLTYDRSTLNILLQEARIGFAGKATAIGDAIGIAVKHLKDRPAENRVLILLSDGADTASELPPAKAAELAADYGVRIHTIGIGADAVMRRGFFGSRTFRPSMDLDEELLTHIADTTGGQYFRATDPEQLVEIYQLLDQLEPVAQEEEVVRPTRDLFHWPLAGAFVSCLLLMAIRRRGWRHA